MSPLSSTSCEASSSLTLDTQTEDPLEAVQVKKKNLLDFTHKNIHAKTPKARKYKESVTLHEMENCLDIGTEIQNELRELLLISACHFFNKTFRPPVPPREGELLHRGLEDPRRCTLHFQTASSRKSLI